MANETAQPVVQGGTITPNETGIDWSKYAQPPTPTPSAAPPSAAPSDDDIRAMATGYNLDPDIISRQIMQESGGKQSATSSKGARGLMQLMPETAKRLGVNIDDPMDNLQGGMREMHRLLTKYNGDYPKALAAYNAGEGAVDKANGIPNYAETQQYVKAIMGKGADDGTVAPPQTASDTSAPTGIDWSKYGASTPTKPTVGPTPGVMQTDVIPAIKGALEGIRTGFGVPDTATPFHDFAKALNEQVNRIATTPWATGGPLWGVISTAGNGIYTGGKSTLEGMKEAYDASKNNDVEGFYKGAGKSLTSAMLLKSLTSTETDPMTLGMKNGGLSAKIERIANRFPGTNSSLLNVYNKVADGFNNYVVDAVNKVSGVKGDPQDIVGTLNKGADSVKALAQTAYQPLDNYVINNHSAFLQTALSSISHLDPTIIKEIDPQDLIDHPVNALKQAQDLLYKKGKALTDGGQGIAGHGYFQLSDDLGRSIDTLVASTPQQIQDTYATAQRLYGQQAAMRDTAGHFDANLKGLPPNVQPKGLAPIPQHMTALSLTDALRDGKNFSRLSQAFGPDVASAILEHSHRVAATQSLMGGTSFGAGAVSMMYGTSLLARIMTKSGLSTIPAELAGVSILSKILSNPPSFPAYANMLRSTSQAGQEYWGKKAVDSAQYGDSINHSMSQLSPADIKSLGDSHGSIQHPQLREDISGALQQYGH